MMTRHAGSWASALLALVVACPAPGGAVPGDLDRSFGTGGRATVAFPGDASPRDLVLLPDGRMVLGGTLLHRDTGDFTFALARLDASGELDSAFGEGGITVTHFPDNTTGGQLRQIARLGDGKLLVGGVDFPNAGFGSVLARYGQDGTLDESFGDAGIRRLSFGTFVGMVVDDLAILALTREPANVGHTRTLRLLAGPLEVSYDVNRPEDVRARAMAALADGRIVFVEAGPQMFVTRSEGIQVDPSFGTQGEVLVPQEVALTEATSIVPLPDGRLLITGHLGALGDARPGIVRLLSDGTPDASFGEGGRVLLQDRPGADDVREAVPLADGRLIVGGLTCEAFPFPSPCTGFLARLLEDGSLDSSFGVGGLVNGLPALDAIALLDEEHLLALGKEEQKMVVTRHVLSTCGNGVIEAGETCDDANRENGDCCADDCTADTDGSACAPDGSTCTADVCRAGACTHEPPAEAGCAIARSAALVLVDAADDAGDRVRLSWASTTVSSGALGDPTSTTDVSLCVIDGPPEARRLVAELTAPAGAACGAAPCWRRTGSGFRYRDLTRSNDGIRKLVLSLDGTDGSLLLKAKGPGIGLGTPATGNRLLVRVVQSDVPGCFESTVVSDGSGTTRLRATTR